MKNIVEYKNTKRVMKNLKTIILEGSILADVEDTMKTGDLFAEVQDKLDFTAKFNNKYKLDLHSKLDFCNQPISVGDVVLCEWLGAVRPGVVISINNDELVVTFDGDTNIDFNRYRKHNRMVGFDIKSYRVIKCTNELIKAIKKMI